MSKASDRLKVLMVTSRYYPYMGGIETHVHEVGRRLASRKDMQVTLLTTALDPLRSQLPREEIVDGMHVIRVRSWPPQSDYYIAPEIYSIIKNGRWDLIHCQGCHTFVPPLAMIAARNAKIPYVVTFHTGGHRSRLRTWIRSSQWRVLRPLFAEASKLIGVSRFEADYFRNLLHLPLQKFTVIPNGGGLPMPEQAPAAVSSCMILSIGRLERYKGHHHLITALPYIRQKRPDAQLLIVGAGPYEAELRKLAQTTGVAEHVTIQAIPPGNRSAMAELMLQAKLVALFSEYEAHPVAVMEALSLHRPVLVAYTSGLQELADQGLVYGIPLHSTPQEIATAALQQIEHPHFSTALTLPTWESCTNDVLSVYNTAIGRSK